MDSELYFGLLIPVISGVFSLISFVIWWRNKERRFVIPLAAGFFICSVAHLAAHFVEPNGYIASQLLYSSVGFALAIFGFGWAVYQRVNLHPPMVPLAFIGVSGLMLAYIAGATQHTLNLQIFFLDTTIGLLLCVGARNYRKVTPNSGVSTALFIVMLVVGVQTMLVSDLTVWLDGPLDEASYSVSTFKYAKGFSTAMSLLMLAAGLVVAYVADMIKELRVQSERDHLTGLKNRAAFEEDIQRLFEPDHPPMEMSLLVIDIDNFKSVNDEFGHPTGDAVIKAFGGIIDRAMRPGDIAGRIGGEEFCALLSSADPDTALQLAETMRTCFAALAIPGIPSGRYVTASIGIATVRSEEDYASVYRRADEALYNAKRAGRNTVLSDQEIIAARILAAKKRIQICTDQTDSRMTTAA